MYTEQILNGKVQKHSVKNAVEKTFERRSFCQIARFIVLWQTTSKDSITKDYYGKKNSSWVYRRETSKVSLANYLVGISKIFALNTFG